MDGLDGEPEARRIREYGLMCRTYSVDGRREGLPSREMLRHAIQEVGNCGWSHQSQDNTLHVRPPWRFQFSLALLKRALQAALQALQLRDYLPYSFNNPCFS
jgi:hypothetical protein